MNSDWQSSASKNRCIYTLMSAMPIVLKMVKLAKQHYVEIKNFETASGLLKAAEQLRPLLIILDWDQREVESFKVLNERAKNADLNSVAAIGYVSQSKSALMREAQAAGADRIYTKTDFSATLADILLRYAL